MSDKGNPRGPGSRIIRERAMAVLRETRAKIDPLLLAAMKDRLSALMPQAADPPPTPAGKNDVFGELKGAAAPKTESVPQPQDKFVYPSKPLNDPAAESEPVDRQKIAQIVLQYMKNREEKSKH